MARTVDTSSTFEDWRQKYNNLATDVGGLSNLTTGDKTSIVNAVNYLMDQYFFFQDFDFDGSDGATSNTVFSGADNAGTTLAYSPGKVLVFKNGALLRSGTDYAATNGTSITLGSSAGNSDVIRVQAFTGSYESVGSASTGGAGQFLLAGDVIHNTNTGGVILNGDSSITTALDVANTIQLTGDTHAVGDISIKSLSNTRNELRLFDNDNSNYVALKSGATVGSNLTFTLPTADGSNGQFLKTDGSGNFSFGTVSATAPDVNITANNTADETTFLTFVDGATGTQGLESDTGLTYNPSSGVLTSTTFSGALSGNASTATTLATNRNFSITGAVTASAVAFNGSGVVTLSTSLAADSVDSQHYKDDSIDADHIADNAINSQHYVDGSIDSEHIADDAIHAGKMAISNGNGSSGQLLASDGDGTFTFTAAPSGTTNLSQTTATGQLTISSSTGTDIIVAEATTNIAGLMSTTHHDKLDGIATSANNFSLPLSSSSTRGGVKIGFTESGKNYPVELLSEKMFVNVPWSDTNTDTNTNQLTVWKIAASGTGGTENVSHNDTVTFTGAGATTVTRSGDDITITSTDTNTNLSNSQVKAAVEAATDSNTFTDADHTKLNGIAASATNVTNNNQITNGAGFTTYTSNQATNTGSLVKFEGLRVGDATAAPENTIECTGDIIAFASSDERLKDNIKPITNSLEKVGQLKGYEFDWNDKQVVHSGHDVGVIAQEVEKVVPEIVETREHDGYKAVKYEKLVPLLINAINELKTELDELKSSKI